MRDNPLAQELTWETVRRSLEQGPFGLRNLSYAMDRLWWKGPQGHHLGNLIWYAILVLLVWWMLAEIGGQLLAAFWGALLFALHPLHVEPVVWLSCRKDLLMGALMVASLAMHLRWRRRGGWGWRG